MTHKLTPLWCMLPESGLNWTAWLMKPSHEMYFMFTVTSTACSSSRTHFPPGLYSLYYHSHLSPYVFIHCTIIHTLPPIMAYIFIHCTIIHTFPPCLYSCTTTHTFPPMSLFTVLSLTPFPLCLYSLYYHSHLTPYHGLYLYSLYYHSHLSPMSLFTVLPLTPFPLCLYSLYYHSHLSPYVFIHCTIIHTFPPIMAYVFIHCTITHTFPPMSLFTVLSFTHCQCLLLVLQFMKYNKCAGSLQTTRSTRYSFRRPVSSLAPNTHSTQQ